MNKISTQAKLIIVILLSNMTFSFKHFTLAKILRAIKYCVYVNFAVDRQNIYDKTGVINDPLGQTHSHASSEHCFLLFCFSRFEK